jgi:hypothetical protein
VHCKLLQLHGGGTLACEGTFGSADRLRWLRNVGDCIIACSHSSSCARCSAAAWHVSHSANKHKMLAPSMARTEYCNARIARALAISAASASQETVGDYLHISLMCIDARSCSAPRTPCLNSCASVERRDASKARYGASPGKWR